MQVGRTSHAATNVRKVRTFRSGPYLDKLFGTGGRVDAYLERQICARIKQARKASGLTQEDMANLLNVTTRAYQNYERDRAPFRRLSEIARLTGVDQEWLLRGDPPPRIDPEDLLSRMEALEGKVATGFEALEAAIEQLAAQLPRRDAG